MNSINSPCHCWYVKPSTRCQCRQNMKPINYWNVQFYIFFCGKRKNQQMLAKFGISRMRERAEKITLLKLAVISITFECGKCVMPYTIPRDDGIGNKRHIIHIFFSFVLHFLKLFRCSKTKPGPMHSWDELCMENAWETLVYDGFICLNGSFVSVKRNQYANVRSFYCLHNANAMAAAAASSL